jgi:hypothetical protein
VALLGLAGCAAPPPPSSVAASGHVAHDPALDRLVTDLAAQGVRWESAGPHHLLGIGEGGVEVDLVGVPLEEAVLSVPAEDAEATLAVMRQHLALIGPPIGAPPELDEWIVQEIGGWDGVAPLGADATFGATEARLRSTGDPAYVVLTVSQA